MFEGSKFDIGCLMRMLKMVQTSSNICLNKCFKVQGLILDV